MIFSNLKIPTVIKSSKHSKLFNNSGPDSNFKNKNKQTIKTYNGNIQLQMSRVSLHQIQFRLQTHNCILMGRLDSE